MGLAGWQSHSSQTGGVVNPGEAPADAHPSQTWSAGSQGPRGLQEWTARALLPSRVKPETFRQPQLYPSSARLGLEGEGRGKSWATASGDTGKHLSGRELFERGSVSFPKGR